MLMSVALVIGSTAERREVFASDKAQCDTAELGTEPPASNISKPSGLFVLRENSIALPPLYIA